METKGMSNRQQAAISRWVKLRAKRAAQGNTHETRLPARPARVVYSHTVGDLVNNMG